MTTTVLTDEKIMAVWGSSAVPCAIRHGNEYLIHKFARAIEQAVLQSPEIQALRKDAERWQFFISNYDEYGTVPYIDGENLRADVDAAMEKQA